MPDGLFVTRNFAPASHVSVERAIKLAKYLPEFGWRPTMLTGAHRARGFRRTRHCSIRCAGWTSSVRVRPSSRCSTRGHAKGDKGSRSASAETRGAAACTRRPGSFPDSQVLWYPFAVRAALSRARAERWDVVVATSHPPTAISSRTRSRHGCGSRT